MIEDIPTKILQKISFSQSGCWDWTGYKDRQGYGKLYFDGRPSRLVHRVVYSLFKDIPDGMEIDHLCRNTSCVNPDHLEPVSKRTNQIRGFGFVAQNYFKTECVNGHAFDEANTIKRAKGRRGCKKCSAAASKRYADRKRA